MAVTRCVRLCAVIVMFPGYRVIVVEVRERSRAGDCLELSSDTNVRNENRAGDSTLPRIGSPRTSNAKTY